MSITYATQSTPSAPTTTVIADAHTFTTTDGDGHTSTWTLHATYTTSGLISVLPSVYPDCSVWLAGLVYEAPTTVSPSSSLAFVCETNGLDVEQNMYLAMHPHASFPRQAIIGIALGWIMSLLMMTGMGCFVFKRRRRFAPRKPSMTPPDEKSRSLYHLFTARLDESELVKPDRVKTADKDAAMQQLASELQAVFTPEGKGHKLPSEVPGNAGAAAKEESAAEPEDTREDV